MVFEKDEDVKMTTTTSQAMANEHLKIKNGGRGQWLR